MATDCLVYSQCDVNGRATSADIKLLLSGVEGGGGGDGGGSSARFGSWSSPTRPRLVAHAVEAHANTASVDFVIVELLDGRRRLRDRLELDDAVASRQVRSTIDHHLRLHDVVRLTEQVGELLGRDRERQLCDI